MINYNLHIGITTWSTFGKVLTSIQFAVCFKKIPELQAGFMKGYCTTNNICSLQYLVQKCLIKSSGRFYCLFVYFRNVFDFINRKLFWYFTMNNGIYGRLFSVTNNMYSKVKDILYKFCKAW